MTRWFAKNVAAERLLLLEWDGATLAALGRLADDGTMPNMAHLFRHSARRKLRWAGVGSSTAAWTTLRSGCGPAEHGVWDDSYLDHRRGWVRPVDPAAIATPMLPGLLRARDGGAVSQWISDSAASARIWARKLTDRDTLEGGIRQTKKLLDELTAEVRRIATATPWRLFEVRVHTVAALQHRVWRLLGVDAEMDGASTWTATSRQAFVALDHMLGDLAELADRQNAALALVSPYGFVRAREKITLAELFRRRGLFETAGGIVAAEHRLRRRIWRSVRPLVGRKDGPAATGVHYPIRALLPADWRRSRAVALHGDHAALVYLNTPGRFGTRVLATAGARRQALADTIAALGEARHPVSGDPLFSEVIGTADTYGCDPLERSWPDVVGVPAPGFQTRHKPDHKRQLLRPDPSLAGTQGGDGFLLLCGRGIQPEESPDAELTDVAPLLMQLLPEE